MEEWKPIFLHRHTRIYTHYSVSDMGRVRNDITGKILKSQIMQKGYVVVNFYTMSLRVHMLVWTTFNGVVPNGLQIDHKNEIKTDNRLVNLQLLTNRENKAKSIRAGGKILPVGVSYCKNMRKYQVQIRVGMKQKFLGYFNCPTTAMFAYERAKQNLL